MTNAIGEAMVHQFVRTSYNSQIFDKDQDIQKTDKIKKQRPVEESEDGQKSEMSLQSQDNMKARNSPEEGQTIIEKYDERGQLVRRTPSGHSSYAETT